jgi:hypothetical protein
MFYCKPLTTAVFKFLQLRVKLHYNPHDTAVQGVLSSADAATADSFCIEFQKFTPEKDSKPS